MLHLILNLSDHCNSSSLCGNNVRAKQLVFTISSVCFSLYSILHASSGKTVSRIFIMFVLSTFRASREVNALGLNTQKIHVYTVLQFQKKFWTTKDDFISNFVCPFVERIWTSLQLFLARYKNVIQLRRFQNLQAKLLLNHRTLLQHAQFVHNF
jgi:hypothetical protein